ncbi:CubicO group peptidase, beta-lactamase class C family [Thermoactinomyces sp. DSM 45891]|uniref:serine hydrolase domain-containing protein n=1 Tax=Thermoactinomyces sp. DSM 45891 TaxID=1761907 RepID=UPI00091CCF76|nr:serine hydrolase domain-containing protein [Thermoactinomyces sp. DSM 45891]SFX21692.1 CubicO group peptidase, beta-lactamase class C family [Thermoactinomyces sp. DSM 45891]
MERLVSYFQEKRPNFSGTVLIAKKGKIVFHEAFGKSDFNTEIQNTLCTRFPIASLTKTFTSLAIFQLMEQNRLYLSDSLDKYFSDSSLGEVTIQHLLNHTSGVVDYRNVIGELSSVGCVKDEMWKQVRDQNLSFLPGSKFSCNDTNTFLLAMILEKVTDMPYRDYVREKIFVPAGMEDSGFEGEALSLLAEGHIKGKKQSLRNSNNGYGCGDIISTTKDLHHFLQCYKRCELLNRDSKNRMETVSFRRKKWLDVSLIASGWFYQFIHGMSIGYSGIHPSGFLSRWELNMNHDTEIIILSNNAIPYHWYDSKWNGVQSIATELGEILFENRLSALQKLLIRID